MRKWKPEVVERVFKDDSFYKRAFDILMLPSGYLIPLNMLYFSALRIFQPYFGIVAEHYEIILEAV